MSKRTKSARGRVLAERRRSNASGLHIKRRKDRANAKRRAIDESRREG